MHRVAQVHVGGGHVDLGAQHARAVRELAGAHALEQVQVLLDRAVAVGAVLARLGQRAAVLADLLGAQVIHIGLALLDQLERILVQLLEIVRGVKQPLVPVEAQPADVLLDRVDVLDSSLVGLVSSKRRLHLPPNSRAMPKFEADRLGVPDVQVAVGLGRKAGLHPPAVFARAQILADDLRG